MSHGITGTDQMFSVRQAPWHGLGVVLPEYPTREEAQALVHPWEPVTGELYRRTPRVREGELYGEWEVVPGQEVSRSDNGAHLGIVSSTYTPVSNREMWDVAEALEGQASGDVMYETGGSLDGGKRVWLLVRLREPLSVPRDPNGATVPYYSLQNAHDGTGAFRGQATMVRVVCANTSHLADLDSRQRGTTFRFSHTKNVAERIEEAKQALEGWRAGLETWQQQMVEWSRTPVSDAGIKEFIDRFIPAPPEGTYSDVVRENVRQARGGMSSVLYGQTCVGVEHTVYGLVCAASEWSEHVRRAKDTSTRFRRAVLDTNQVISKAAELAQLAATV